MIFKESAEAGMTQPSQIHWTQIQDGTYRTSSLLFHRQHKTTRKVSHATGINKKRFYIKRQNELKPILIHST